MPWGRVKGTRQGIGYREKGEEGSGRRKHRPYGTYLKFHLILCVLCGFVLLSPFWQTGMSAPRPIRRQWWGRHSCLPLSRSGAHCGCSPMYCLREIR